MCGLGAGLWLIDVSLLKPVNPIHPVPANDVLALFGLPDERRLIEACDGAAAAAMFAAWVVRHEFEFDAQAQGVMCAASLFAGRDVVRQLEVVAASVGAHDLCLIIDGCEFVLSAEVTVSCRAPSFELKGV